MASCRSIRLAAPLGGNQHPARRPPAPPGRLPSPLARLAQRWESGAMSEMRRRGGSTMTAKSIATPTLAARAGRWSAQHRKKAIWGWLAFAVVAFMLGGAIGTKTQTTAQSGVGESGRAARTVDNAFPKHQVEETLVQSNGATASDRSFRAVVGDVRSRPSA